MKTVNVVIEHAETNLSAYVEDVPIITIGDTIEEIEKNIREAINLTWRLVRMRILIPEKYLRESMN